MHNHHKCSDYKPTRERTSKFQGCPEKKEYKHRANRDRFINSDLYIDYRASI